MTEPNYTRSLWQLDIDGTSFELEALGDVSWNPPEELSNVTVLKGAGGRGAKFDQMPEANVSTFTISVVQETREEGILWELAHGGSAVKVSFRRQNSDAAEDLQVIGVASDRAQIRFGGSPTWADNAQVFPYSLTCIGYTVQRKNATDIVR